MLTITEAIKQSGIGRTAFYSKINKGLISVSMVDGKKAIDPAELVRVFGSGIQVENKVNSDSDLNKQAEQELIIKHLTERLEDANERVNDYKATVKRLESPDKAIAERLEREREEIRLEREQLNKERIKLVEAMNRPNAIARWWRGLGDKDES
jgi:hypothetical protein